jgi:hypothetical protein
MEEDKILRAIDRVRDEVSVLSNELRSLRVRFEERVVGTNEQELLSSLYRVYGNLSERVRIMEDRLQRLEDRDRVQRE